MLPLIKRLASSICFLAFAATASSASDYEAPYGIQNDELTAAFLYQCLPMGAQLSDKDREYADLQCNMRAKSVTLKELLAMMTGCTTVDSESKARAACSASTADVQRHFAVGQPARPIPAFHRAEIAIIDQGCAGLKTGVEQDLCRSGVNKLQTLP